MITDGSWRRILEETSETSDDRGCILLLEDLDGSFKFELSGQAATAAIVENEEAASGGGSARTSLSSDGRHNKKTAAVDAVNVTNKNASSLTYQGVLQLLESGLFPLIFMTTNSLETVERMKALDRPGRIDKK